jgi:hypothetical protein
VISGRWGWRALGFLALAVGLGATAYLGAEFHPVELVATALAVCALAWMSTDLANQLFAAKWEGAPSRSEMNRGRDFRLAYLTRLLGEDDLTLAHKSFVAITDAVLVSRFGISLASDPGRARAVLGERLHDFVTRAPVASPYDYHRRLPEALTRLEELSA